MRKRTRKTRVTLTEAERKQRDFHNTAWLDDHWGMQGTVMFYLGKYWGVKIKEDGVCVPTFWTEEAWEKRKTDIAEGKKKKEKESTPKRRKKVKTTKKAKKNAS